MIKEALIDYTERISNFDTKRDYVSLSHCYLPIEKILEQFTKGFYVNGKTKLKCYKGYQMEEDLKRRMKHLFSNRIKEAEEIVAFNGLVKGHPDFQFDNLLGDCKSVLKDDWIWDNGKIPNRVFYQMQGYMHYSDFKKSIIILESRESGLIQEYIINYNDRIGKEINEKMIQVKEKWSI